MNDWDRAIDAIGRALEPRALWSEREAMKQMGPIRLGLHLIFRTAWDRLYSSAIGPELRPASRWAGVLLWSWRQYRRTW